MNTKKILSTVAIAFALALSSCSESEDINTVNSTNDQNFKVVFVQGRLDVSQARGSNAAVCFRKHKVAPDANGNFVINDTVYRSNISARQLASDNISDTVRIVIGKDTLREIPVNSWSNILPTNYIVQRNISATVATWFAGKTVEALWWSNDSIAHVITLGQGTSSTTYSGYIYSVYDDSAYGVNAVLYNLLARIKSGDSLIAYTSVSSVTARAGDMNYVANQFVEEYKFFSLGYTKTPDDSSVSVYAASKAYQKDTVLISDSTTKDLVITSEKMSVSVPKAKFDRLGYKHIVIELAFDSVKTEDTVALGYKVDSAIGSSSYRRYDTVNVVRTVGMTSIKKTIEISAGKYYGVEVMGPYSFTNVLTAVLGKNATVRYYLVR